MRRGGHNRGVGGWSGPRFPALVQDTNRWMSSVSFGSKRSSQETMHTHLFRTEFGSIRTLLGKLGVYWTDTRRRDISVVVVVVVAVCFPFSRERTSGISHSTSLPRWDFVLPRSVLTGPIFDKKFHRADAAPATLVM
jgi:hypothetical protein